ncbi:MAG: hypothetical protein HKN47_06840 [Pirellulaceae bacterium]|nr:hypothetical protein [Pirellulaceae bacterium]
MEETRESGALQEKAQWRESAIAVVPPPKSRTGRTTTKDTKSTEDGIRVLRGSPFVLTALGPAV